MTQINLSKWAAEKVMGWVCVSPGIYQDMVERTTHIDNWHPPHRLQPAFHGDEEDVGVGMEWKNGLESNH